MTDNSSDPYPQTPSPNGAKRDGQYSRRHSAASSQLSSSTTSPNYDSGNISDLNLGLRLVSLSSAEDESSAIEMGEHSRYQHLLREKDQSLFLALQDVRRLKSELERLSKSEKWYKSELRSQKNSRMEILEKLYENERKFTKENQRLQNECISLYTRCSEIESQLQEERDLAKKLLKCSLKDRVDGMDGVEVSRDFQVEQTRQKIADQEELIGMLRNQKRSLLKDLQKLGSEKDEIVLQLQKNIAQLEDENRTITKRCMQLVEANICLKDELMAKEVESSSMTSEVFDLQLTVKDLQEKLHSNITELNQKENAIEALKQELCKSEQSAENINLLQRQHQHELLEKQESINLLTVTINSLKSKIDTLDSNRVAFEERQHEIDQLKGLLQERTSEVEDLQRFITKSQNNPTNPSENTSNADAQFKEHNAKLTQQNLDLRRKLNSMQSMHEASSQSVELENLRKTNQELEQLSEKYLQICKLYEQSKFDSDMKDITVEKFKFEKEKDTREITNLRSKLVEVSRKFECQKSLATEFEFALSRSEQDKRRIEIENKCNIDKNVMLKVETTQSAKESYDKDVEIDNLKKQLSKVEGMINTASVSTLMQEKTTSEERVALIQRLIGLQSEKVNLINAEQQEWENLVTVFSSEVTPENTYSQSSELDELNKLFEEQNLELMQINENAQRYSSSLEQVLAKKEQENQTFQEELVVARSMIATLEQQVETLEKSNADYHKEIAHLAGTNERLIQEFNADFTHDRENHKRQTKQIEAQVKAQAGENDQLREQIQLLQSELDARRLFEANLQQNDSLNDAAQHKILQNVLETEHQRKMNRYDVHIRSLLSNIKSLKRNLEVSDNRYESLLAKSKEMIEVEELRSLEKSWQTMRTQFENSQSEVNNLKQQMELMKEQLCASDAGKSSSPMDLTNLMDDYKKLIQQSHTATKRPSTSEIYQLINKSNNYVPKLTNISNSVDGLRGDIQQLCTVLNQTCPPAGRCSPQQPKMSLMDELKLAENRKMC